MYFSHISSYLMSFLLLVSLSGCGIIDYYFLPPPEDTAQELYEGAKDAMAEKNYPQAAEYFSRLKDSFPFSPYTVEAELALGDALFLEGDYVAATEAYKDFESLHPRHEAMPYVLYQIGMSGLKSFISIDRPTLNIQESQEYFARLKEMYPNSEYSKQVEPAIHEGRKLLAEHELYLGDVFWNMNRFGPAFKRYTFIIETYPDVTEITEHAQKKANAAYLRYREQDATAAKEAIQGSWKKMFDWL